MTNPAPLSDAPLQRLPRRARPYFTQILLPLLALISGALLGLAVPSLIDAQSLSDYLKAGLIALSGAGVAYGVNRLAVERGALQAAIRTPGALLVSTGAILTVGAGLFAATYAGFTIERTDQLRLQAYGETLSAYIDARTQAALGAARIEPAVVSIRDDLDANAACERQSNCVSGGGQPGEGPVFWALNSEHQQAAALAAQIAEGATRFEAERAHLASLRARYSAAIGDASLSPADRRIAAQTVAVEIEQTLGALSEAIPVALSAAYADGLRTPIRIQDRPDASASVNALRAAYADRLGTVIESLEMARSERPVFPSSTGVSDTFVHLAHFLPIAMIVAVIELIFPIMLWLSTYFGYLARLERDDPADPVSPGSHGSSQPASQRRRQSRPGVHS